MSELQAVYYGYVQLLPDIICDGYVLSDGTAAMSERGTSNLLNIDPKILSRMRTNWPPKSLEFFKDKGLTMRTNLVEVVAKNSPYQGRKIITYDSESIESIIRLYVLAFAHKKLRKNQITIGERCAILLTILVKSALDLAIKEACGFTPRIQTTVRSYYDNAVEQMKKLGFECSVCPDVATKKDITSFLKVPQSTLNSFLSKHSYEIIPIKLEKQTINSMGYKASRMNGYKMNDIVKIVFGMDTEVTMVLKKKMFGSLGTFTQIGSKNEIEWRAVLRKVFSGFDMQTNYPIGESRYYVDYFIVT